jgi:RHS repeat-associated protein
MEPDRGTRDGERDLEHLSACGGPDHRERDTKRFFFQDSLGNTSHLSDEAGNLLERYTYSAFGEPKFYDPPSNAIARTASTKGTRHLFQGQLWTQETGLNDYRNRVEHPIMGVFLQPDPIGFKGDAANIYRFCSNNAVNRTDPDGLLDISATIWNRLAWFAGASTLTSREHDLLRQGQAEFAEPTGNYKDTNVENHFPKGNEIKKGNPGGTVYNIDKVQEIDGILVIQPTLNWYVRSQFKNTTVVKSELEHVNRWLYWQQKGDGAAAIRNFNRNPDGIGNLKTKLNNARMIERQWHVNNLHKDGRHNLETNPAKPMDPAEIRRLIENVGPVEEPYLGN